MASYPENPSSSVTQSTSERHCSPYNIFSEHDRIGPNQKTITEAGADIHANEKREDAGAVLGRSKYLLYAG